MAKPKLKVAQEKQKLQALMVVLEKQKLQAPMVALEKQKLQVLTVAQEKRKPQVQVVAVIVKKLLKNNASQELKIYNSKFKAVRTNSFFYFRALHIHALLPEIINLQPIIKNERLILN